MERLQNIPVIIGESYVTQKTLRVERKGVSEVLLKVVRGPLMDTHHGLRKSKHPSLLTCVAFHCPMEGGHSLTPSGTKCPVTIPPCLGVTLGMPTGTGGYIRSVSFKQAIIY
jgi:hypothetical protein